MVAQVLILLPTALKRFQGDATRDANFWKSWFRFSFSMSLLRHHLENQDVPRETQSNSQSSLHLQSLCSVSPSLKNVIKVFNYRSPYIYFYCFAEGFATESLVHLSLVQLKRQCVRVSHISFARYCKGKLSSEKQSWHAPLSWKHFYLSQRTLTCSLFGLGLRGFRGFPAHWETARTEQDAYFHPLLLHDWGESCSTASRFATRVHEMSHADLCPSSLQQAVQVGSGNLRKCRAWETGRERMWAQSM